MNQSIKVLEQIQQRLSVSMIMTPRSDLRTCKSNDTVESVISTNHQEFTWFPVVTGDGRISQVFDASLCRDAPNNAFVSDFCVPINESLIIGGDASIYEFIDAADKQKFRLVVSGNEVSGLVTISDLQQLPVRVAIFSLITNLEIVLADVITSQYPDDNDWIKKLSPNRQAKLQAAVDRSRKSDLAVSKMVLTQFADKTSLAIKLDLIDLPNVKLRELFEKINMLRNEIAHSANFADDDQKATELCSTVKNIFEIKKRIRSANPAS
jgi:hypothetical protein